MPEDEESIAALEADDAVVGLVGMLRPPQPTVAINAAITTSGTILLALISVILLVPGCRRTSDTIDAGCVRCTFWSEAD
jgi:hypothetical protein